MSENKTYKTSINNEKNKKTNNDKYNSFSLPNQNHNLRYKKATIKKITINPNSELEFLYNDSQEKTIASNKIMKLIKKQRTKTNHTLNNRNSSDFLNYKNIKTRTFSEFWSSVQEHEKEKNDKINNLKKRILIKQNKELKYRPSISKRSLTLANLKKRQPFYLKKPLNEERNLDGSFLKFYKKLNLKNKEKIDEQKTQEKFNKFYQDNIKWKSNIIKYNQLVYDKNRINSFIQKDFTFKPIIDKNSIKIVKELDKFNQLTLDSYNDLNNFEIDKKIMEQFKLKIKPVLNEYLDKKNKKVPYVNRRSYNLVKSLTQGKSVKNLYRNRLYQVIPRKNLITEEQKDNLISKEENDNERLKFPKKRTYEKYILQKLKEGNRLEQEDKKDIYKLNIMQGTATNNTYANKIMSNKKYSYIIEDFM